MGITSDWLTWLQPSKLEPSISVHNRNFPFSFLMRLSTSEFARQCPDVYYFPSDTERERGRRKSRKFSVKSNLLLRGFFSKLKVYFQLSTHEQLFKGGQMIPLQKSFQNKRKRFQKSAIMFLLIRHKSNQLDLAWSQV